MKHAPTWTRPPAPRTREWLAIARWEGRARDELPLRRRVPDSSLLRCMIYSSLAHAGVMLVVLLTSRFPDLPGGGGGGGPLVVSLVNLAGPARGEMKPAPAPLDLQKPQEKRPVKPTPKVEPSKPAPKPVENAMPVPVADPPSRKPTKPSEPQATQTAKNPPERIADLANGGEPPAAGQSAPSSWSGAGHGSGFGNGTGPGAGSGSGRIFARVDESFTYDYYLQVVAAKIAAVWAPPLANAQSGETAAIVRFRILREGRVQSAEVETTSSLPVFDASAREAILRAQPFPPFPPGYRGQWLTIHLRFTVGG